jgi:predicted RNA-binding protein with PIN domain
VASENKTTPVEGPPVQSTPVVWLVDGFNVLHAGVLRGRDRADWWKAPRRQQLLDRVARFDDPAVRIEVVFDGPDDAAHTGLDGRLRPVFAPSADDWLLARLRQESDPSRVAIVTADRAVAERARHRGAQVVSPRTFLDRCRAPDAPETHQEG